MDNDRRMRLWLEIVESAPGVPVTVQHACAVAISAAGVTAATITVKLRATPRETIYASDHIAAKMEELALTLGEGPGIDSFVDSPTLVTDLTTADCLARWPMFAPAAVAAGIRAMFALPLRVGGIVLGVVCLYRTRPGNLGREQLADVLVLVDIIWTMLLDAQQEDPPPSDGGLPTGFGLERPEVHQATGMIIAQLGVTAAVALIRLRAHAFAHDRVLSDVARDVVARRLRFCAGEAGAGP